MIRFWRMAGSAVTAFGAMLAVVSPSNAALAKVVTINGDYTQGLGQGGILLLPNKTAVFASSGAVTSTNVFVSEGVSGTTEYMNNGFVPKFTLATSTSTPMTYAGTLSTFNGFFNMTAAGFDTSTGFGYFASSGSPSGIAKIPLTAAATAVGASSTTLLAGQNRVQTIAIDETNGFGYFATGTSPAIVVKVRLSDLTTGATSQLAMDSGFGRATASALDTTNGYLYVAGDSSPGTIAEIRLSNFQLVQTISMPSGSGIRSLLYDASRGALYAGTGDSPGLVFRIQRSGLTVTHRLQLAEGQNDLRSAVLDSSRGFAYFGTNTSSGTVAAVWLTNFTEATYVTLTSTESYLRGAVIDTTLGYAYFSTYTSTGRVVQIDLMSGAPMLLTQPRSLSLHEGQTGSWSVIADGRQLAYQWQLNGADIAGATSATYSRPVSVDDDQKQIRCQITGLNGVTTSDNALITVVPTTRAYPNPWRSDRHAGNPVLIDGLLPNSEIKIFDLSAHWVKTLRLNGQSASWDLTNDAGEPVASGYYFWVATTGNSDQRARGKIAVIR